MLLEHCQLMDEFLRRNGLLNIFDDEDQLIEAMMTIAAVAVPRTEDLKRVFRLAFYSLLNPEASEFVSTDFSAMQQKAVELQHFGIFRGLILRSFIGFNDLTSVCACPNAHACSKGALHIPFPTVRR